jgi:tRNA threonylcarbamoyladenosine biosynthesis protein TsaB
LALILNIETSTEMCSVALAKDGNLLAYRESNEPKAHAANLTLFIDYVIKVARINYKDLDAIAISKGPGSYTGLRIGVSTAKGLCFALNKPFIAVNTLQAFASFFMDAKLSETELKETTKIFFCPMIDARRMEVYTAVFDDQSNFVEETRAQILKEDSFNNILARKTVVFFGNGATKWIPLAHTCNNAIIIRDCSTSARGMVKWSQQYYKSGLTEDLAYFEPYYLKDFVTVHENPEKLKKPS